MPPTVGGRKVTMIFALKLSCLAHVAQEISSTGTCRNANFLIKIIVSLNRTTPAPVANPMRQAMNRTAASGSSPSWGWPTTLEAAHSAILCFVVIFVLLSIFYNDAYFEIDTILRKHAVNYLLQWRLQSDLPPSPCGHSIILLEKAIFKYKMLCRSSKIWSWAVASAMKQKSLTACTGTSHARREPNMQIKSGRVCDAGCNAPVMRCWQYNFLYAANVYHLWESVMK